MSRPQRLTRAGVVLFTTVAVGAVGAPALAASTGTASVSGSRITFKAAVERGNSVTITRSGRTVTIDDRVKIKPGKGCKAVKGDRTKVRCTTKKNPAEVAAYLYDGNDTLVNRTSIRTTVSAGPGNDRITGGSGNDRLVGDSGNDRIWGGAGHDSLDGGSGHDIVDGGSGNDRIGAQTGNDKVYGGSGNDTLSGGSGDDRVVGGDGNDTLNADSGNDSLDGGAGHDRLVAGTGNDKLWGGSGNDRLFGNDGNDLLYAADGNDHLDGGAGDDGLYGEAGNDRLVGDRGNDREYGGTGNDTFDQNVRIGTDSDLFVGGAGQDLVTYEKRTENLYISNDGRTGDDGASNWYPNADEPDTGYRFVSYEKDTISADVEDLTGGRGGDAIKGNYDPNVLRGTYGLDDISGGGANDRLYGSFILDGGDGIDLCRGEHQSGKFYCELD
ncbi:calcium-binding protein [Actinoplanes sp. NPDC023714]|uniref:calcium-binding protein n=1 Tax=Actinoplanes sp. NPDC023714 TaxID=3154322 RepID=UPI0033CC2A86